MIRLLNFFKRFFKPNWLFAIALTVMSLIALEVSAGSIIESVTVSNGELSMVNWWSYIVELPKSTDKITLTVHLDQWSWDNFSPVASFRINGEETSPPVGYDLNLELTLQQGENVFIWEFLVEEKVLETCTITVIRGIIADYYLTNLAVSAGTLSPAFAPKVNTYRVTVPKCMDNIKLIATPDSEDAIVSGSGEKQLNLGENTFDITVSTPNGSTVYTVIVTRRSDDYLLEFLHGSESTTGNTKKTFLNLAKNQYATVSLIDLHKLEYVLMTDNFSGALPLHFDIEDGRYTYDKTVNVEANSIYKITLNIGIKYESDGSSTTYFDDYGRPNAIRTCGGSIIFHAEYDSWSNIITTYVEYIRRQSNMAVSNGNESLSVHEFNITGNAISTISASDLTFVGTGIICETSGIVAAKDTDKIKIYPNPTTGIIYTGTESDIKVYNPQGALLQSIVGSQIDLSDYPQGIYIMQVNGEWVKVVKK